MKTLTRKAKVLETLRREKKVTNSQLVRIGGGYRYGGRIHELRQEGHVIVTNIIGNGRVEYTYRGKRKN